MANFAKLDNNNTVLAVIAVSDNDAPTEAEGIQFLTNLFGYSNWKQTSYNTRGGVYYQPNSNTPAENQSKAFRANHARVGWVYDEVNNIFRDNKPSGCDSWTLNTTSGEWEPPVARPTIEQMTDGENEYQAVWNNANNRWQATNDDKNHYWNSESSSWVSM
tara:strand:- start:8379 stop:8861 length:483 start_codon:yes stop_codon:yes gene_type:complete